MRLKCRPHDFPTSAVRYIEPMPVHAFAPRGWAIDILRRLG
jgi:hypothetical protein